MKWEMEIEEIETVLEKIWDLHDKLSDAIHSISRAHFLSSVKSLRYSGHRKSAVSDEERVSGYVYVKDFRLDSGDEDDCAIQEAKSLNAIRAALESLEDHLEILHTVQVQQQAERDAAVVRLEQSRMVLAMRLAEHQGKNYKVIEEALAFVGDVKEANRFSSPEKVYADSRFASSHGIAPTHERKRSNVVFDLLFSGFSFAKKTLKLDFLGGVLGNSAMIAITMVALLHLQQAANSDHRRKLEGVAFPNRRVRIPSSIQESSSEDRSSSLDVLLARG